MRYFHFTLGPVQSFVAQARRTRDFWAGSFLLSWLSAVAIQAVKVQGGTVSFPVLEENYFIWLTRGSNSHAAPTQGCIPNRFKGVIAEVPAGFDPLQVVDSVRQAWLGLADAVWEYDLADFAHTTPKTQAIWARQVRHFWEIHWALADDQGLSNLLDRRKNTRSYFPPDEEGVKCMVMDGWQELSGIDTPNAKGLELFWKPLREANPKLAGDLREGEYLCAIAFIKRRFARCFKDFSKPITASDKTFWTVHGWDVNPSVPSVSYMAAAPWLAQMLSAAPEHELLAFHNKAQQLTQSYGEYNTNLRCINQVIGKRVDKLFSSLDGDVFFEAALDNANRFRDQALAQQVKSALAALRAAVNRERAVDNSPPLGAVSPFYAVLMMDGDSLGVQLSEPDKQIAIGASLAYFTRHAPAIVEQHSGFLIYAGGDDVLALLPLEFALACAYQLRLLYLQGFALHGAYSVNSKPGQVESTLSGAIEYAHIKMPLAKVLADAHLLLDDIAKTACGRDAIAVRVWKPGGQHLQWAMPWRFAVDNKEVVVNKIAEKFSNSEQDTPFSNAFFFNVAERFGMLQSKDSQGEWRLADGIGMDTLIKLIAVEFLSSGVGSPANTPTMTLAQAEAHIKPLIQQCMPVRRLIADGHEYFVRLNQLNIDAAHFVYFLVTKGVEHG